MMKIWVCFNKFIYGNVEIFLFTKTIMYHRRNLKPYMELRHLGEIFLRLKRHYRLSFAWDNTRRISIGTRVGNFSWKNSSTFFAPLIVYNFFLTSKIYFYFISSHLKTRRLEWFKQSIKDYFSLLCFTR